MGANSIRRVEPSAFDAAVGALTTMLGERLSRAAAVREHHAKDESWHAPALPDAVVFPRTTEEVAEIVKICARYKVPMIPFGTGTSLEGHVIPTSGGISIDMMEMNKVIRVSPEDLDVTVQPGVTRKQLNEHLKATGLFFPIDPGADASIGGMTATRASGTNAVRYGTMRENVLGLTVVMPDGRIVRTARRARKSAAGYDLTRLMVGSEGTLGVITEVTLKLYGIPEAISAAVCSFETVGGAVDTVIATIQSGIPVARIELFDEHQMDATNKYSGLSYPVCPTLFLEFHGTESGVVEQAETVQALSSEHGGSHFQWSLKPEERSKLWQARHDAAYAVKAARPGRGLWVTDVCVPISRLADCILETKKDLDASFLYSAIVGHVGDGNFHISFLVDRSLPEELAEAERLNDRLIARALMMDGTCTGEHGIGIGKIQYLQAEHGDGVSVMRQLKQAIDPDNLMNPGKIFSA